VCARRNKCTHIYTFKFIFTRKLIHVYLIHAHTYIFIYIYTLPARACKSGGLCKDTYMYLCAPIMPTCLAREEGDFLHLREYIHTYILKHLYCACSCVRVRRSTHRYIYIYNTNMMYIYMYNTYLFVRARRGMYFHSREYIHTYICICM